MTSGPTAAQKGGPMRILVADDQELVRDTIAAFLRQEPDIEVEVASDLMAALRCVRETPSFDLILLDYMMPGMNRLAGLAAMRAATSAPVAILSGVAPAVVAEQAVASGAAGFLPKTMSTRSLLAAVRFMAAGEVYMPMNLVSQADQALQDLGATQLTTRETEVLKWISQGMANKEIARELGLQEVTVKLHVKTMSRKLAAKNRTHAAMIARDRKLV
jgi:two-component system nitrate/nitrite response regulator NarL